MHDVQSPADTTSDSAIEREIVSKGLTAPRVTPADIERAIAGVEYGTDDDETPVTTHQAPPTAQ